MSAAIVLPTFHDQFASDSDFSMDHAQTGYNQMSIKCARSQKPENSNKACVFKLMEPLHQIFPIKQSRFCILNTS